MERKEYLEHKFKCYKIGLKWWLGIERTEQDFKEFFIARQYAGYYEGSKRLKQQHAASRLLERLRENYESWD